MTERTRWLFADQLGPHFLDPDRPDQPVLLVESRRVFARRRFHRAKAHLVLSALRHRAAELADRAEHRRVDRYADAVGGRPLEVCHPTSYRALRFVTSLPDVDVLPARGFVTAHEEFARWADGRHGRLLMEDFYRDARRRTGVLMDSDGGPVGGRWNLDADNREPPPRRPGEPRRSSAGTGRGASPRRGTRLWPRWGTSSSTGCRRSARTRTPMPAADGEMAHSQLSVPLNLGLLDPLEVVRAAEDAYVAGAAPLQSVEGFVRQVMGWRDYVWHLYWHQGPAYRGLNALDAHQPVPDWLWDLDADAVTARCLSTVLAQVRDTGWTHHIPRLMVLGSWALQRGVDPAELTEWFHLSFVDGYDWVMVPNVVGMSQHGDGGVMATKPYTSGGAYINRMSDFCRPCAYDPKVRVGQSACPFTAGYWDFMARHRERFEHNPRISRQLGTLDRLADLDELQESERRRGTAPP